MLLAMFTNSFNQLNAQTKMQILANQNGYALTAEHIQIYIGYTELLTMELLSETEKKAIENNMISLFNQYPAQIVSFASGLQSDFATFRQLTDPSQIGFAWGVIKGYFYQNTYSYPDEQLAYFAKLAKDRAPVLAYNQANKAAFTETDLEGFSYLTGLNQYGTNGFNNSEIKNSLRNDIISQFPTLNQQAIASVMYYAYLGTMLKNVMSQLNHTQQNQLLAQLSYTKPTQSSDYGNLTSSEYNSLMDQIIREGNLGRHNTIQDMSVGGYKEYWYSKSSPSSILGW